ncbi:MAG TPA: DUF3096 domain-containing protein [Nitriliruptorales bacterium]|nr:DUF3096 domain-containing protein [Nitriliruptorales bacterium]
MSILLAQQATVQLTLPAIAALVAGILILLFPRILNYVIGIYLIAIALIEMFGLQL